MRAIIIASCALLAQSAIAGEIKIAAQETSSTPAIVTITGQLDPQDEALFNKITAGTRRAVVYLASGGGNAGAGMNIGFSIRKKGYQTAVAG
jgi:hypothetical protein